MKNITVDNMMDIVYEALTGDGDFERFIKSQLECFQCYYEEGSCVPDNFKGDYDEICSTLETLIGLIGKLV